MDPNEQTDVTTDDSQIDSQIDPQGGDDSSMDTTGNSDTTEQQLSPEQLAALQEENKRLKGTVSSLTKKIRGNGSQNQPSNNNGDQQQIDYRTYNATLKMASVDIRQQLEDEVVGLYAEGSSMIPEGEPSLPQSEINWIMRNMWAYVSDQSKDAIVYKNDIQPALYDVEEALANRAALLTQSNPNNPTPIQKRAGGKQVNPSPAPMVQSKNNQQKAEDLWRMPMQDLEKRASQARSDLANE